MREMKRLERYFFARAADTVARDLIGCRLNRFMPDGSYLHGIISETEAYMGVNDTACHTSRGKTKRNEVMFGPPGYFYVYFTYGMHYMLNVVSEPEESACAVLIRALIPEKGIEIMKRHRKGRTDLTDGPAKLTQALAIDKSFNGVDMINSESLFITTSISVNKKEIKTTKRIGIDYAEKKDRDALLRFVWDPSVISTLK